MCFTLLFYQFITLDAVSRQRGTQRLLQTCVFNNVNEDLQTTKPSQLSQYNANNTSVT